ncbi:MAG TPA: peptidylprolyl isomerase [Acidobacteriaceae bacterium]|jgi:peptidyl-prolyl cis-trans isomerase SurA|nr:peptidylprolyl isomerase [Acidobacteriaceae bacterium]
MMLRVSRYSATLAAGVALSFASGAVVPAFAQGRGASAPDVTTRSQSPYQGTVVEDIVAMVNDQAISKSDYDRAQHELDQEAQQQSWSQQQIMEQRRDLLRSLIDRQLLLSKGKDLGINGETEVVKRLDEMRKQYHMDSMEDLQKAAEAQGVSFEDLKEQIREGVITQEVISQEVGHKIDIAPSEVQAYYNAHLSEFQRPEQVKLSEILIPTPNPDDAAQVADAQKKADAVESRLKTGADFATVAKGDSGGPTAQEGGRLGDYKRGDLPKVMEDATFGLETGQYTAPIRTKQGWLILEVTDHTKAGVTPLLDVQNDIQEKIGMTKMEPAMRAYLAKLRDEAAIQVRAPYSDSGATPNEIKFIEGAYQPPQPKKKKHVERARYRQLPSRREKQTATSSTAPPAGVPTLDKVNTQKGAPVQVASAAPGTEKPGKKEKIRFGQAPRETLPAGETKQVDAGASGAGGAAEGQPSAQQVAANDQPPNVVTNAAGEVVSGDQSEKTKKSRYSDRMKETKAKQDQDKAAKKKQKFVPPTETTAQTAQDKQDQSAVGLNGDTTKQKKPNPAKSGPKRRLGDEDKSTHQDGTSAPATPPPATTQPPATTPPPATQSQPQL